MNPDFYIKMFTFSLLKARHTLLNSGVGQSSGQTPLQPAQAERQRRRGTEPPWRPGVATRGLEGTLCMCQHGQQAERGPFGFHMHRA